MEQIWINAILSRIQRDIIENDDEFEKVKKIDMTHCNMQVEINELLKIIENYKNLSISNPCSNLSICCNGNPYVVLNILLIAVITKTNVKINIEDTMVGVNKLILQIIKNVLEENKIDINLEFSDKIAEENMVFIDRVNDYNLYKNKFNSLKYIPYQGIDVFYDDEKYDDLLKKIYNYAECMNIDIDIFEKEEGIDSVFKYGKSQNVLLLTKQKVDINEDQKNIFINENPFKCGNKVFSNDLIKNIVPSNVL